MAFNPRTDVVLEVASAADPSRATLAAQRLNALAAPNAPTADFAADVDRAAAAGSAASAPLANAAGARSRLAEGPGEPDKLRQAKTQFEAMMLNSFVGELLPKDSGACRRRPPLSLRMGRFCLPDASGHEPTAAPSTVPGGRGGAADR
jgi:peptidoglycan hydrolase FlgJ